MSVPSSAVCSTAPAVSPEQTPKAGARVLRQAAHRSRWPQRTSRNMPMPGSIQLTNHQKTSLMPTAGSSVQFRTIHWLECATSRSGARAMCVAACSQVAAQCACWFLVMLHACTCSATYCMGVQHFRTLPCLHVAMHTHLVARPALHHRCPPAVTPRCAGSGCCLHMHMEGHQAIASWSV